MTTGASLPNAPHGASTAARLLGIRHPRRPLLAAVLVSVSVCWLVLVMPLHPPPTAEPATAPRARGSPEGSGALLFPPREGPLPDPAAWRGLSEQQISRFSKLGRMLFLQDTENLSERNKTFVILIWKHGPRLENRHIKHFEDKKYDPFQDCSVRNCRIEYDDKFITQADAIIFHLHLIRGRETLPQRDAVNGNQRWIFLTDESPHNIFMYKKNNNLKFYDGVFNWSMSYRMDSDVPVPYGRTITLTTEEAENALATVPRNYALGKTGIAAIMGSNCGGRNHRWDYVRELQKYMSVDVYGGCGQFSCPGGFRRDCPKIKKYKFYLAFENSNCKEYVTEKAWWNAYKNDVVPVIMGDSQENLRSILPRRSYLHVEDFASPADLARFLIHLDNSDRDYNTYFEWKYKFKIVNEHGYFQSPVYHYCRVCEALNYNDQSTKIYEHPENFMNAERDCHYTN